jgi:hypothetical protein
MAYLRAHTPSSPNLICCETRALRSGSPSDLRRLTRHAGSGAPSVDVTRLEPTKSTIKPRAGTAGPRAAPTPSSPRRPGGTLRRARRGRPSDKASFGSNAQLDRPRTRPVEHPEQRAVAIAARQRHQAGTDRRTDHGASHGRGGIEPACSRSTTQRLAATPSARRRGPPRTAPASSALHRRVLLRRHRLEHPGEQGRPAPRRRRRPRAATAPRPADTRTPPRRRPRASRVRALTSS